MYKGIYIRATKRNDKVHYAPFSIQLILRKATVFFYSDRLNMVLMLLIIEQK